MLTANSVSTVSAWKLSGCPFGQLYSGQLSSPNSPSSNGNGECNQTVQPKTHHYLGPRLIMCEAVPPLDRISSSSGADNFTCIFTQRNKEKIPYLNTPIKNLIFFRRVGEYL
jgi:hypothetical protein